MHKKILGTVAFLLTAACMVPAQAGDTAWEPGTTHFVLDSGISAGGDKLVTVQFSDGSSRTIYAGDGLFADGGAQHNFAGSNWSLKGTLGYRFWLAHASNNDTTFSMVPLDLLAIYSDGRHHFGVGVTEHLGPTLSLGSAFGGNIDFNDATGFMLQYQYWLFGVRYTSIRYTPNCTGCTSVDGSNIGFFFNYVF